MSTIIRIIFISIAALLVMVPSNAVAQYEFDSWSDRIRGHIWEDANCNGIREDGEPLLPNVTLFLRWAGSNGVIDGTDREIISSTSTTGRYTFDLAGAGEPYFIALRAEGSPEGRPAGFFPAPFRQGADRTRDNDLTMPLNGTSLWATQVFVMPADGSVVEGIDIGLCREGTTPNPQGPAFQIFVPLIQR
jgi:hypothetical protein